MGRHKLPFNMKKPNKHHKYWRYVLSTGSRTEISTKTKVKYEAMRKQASNKPISPEILGMKRGQLVNHLQPKFGSIPLDEITQVMYEDWRLTLPLANSTKNDITVVINQIMKEAVRDERIKVNPIQNVESLSKTPEKPRDSLSFEKIVLPPPLSSYPLLLLNIKFI